MRPEILFPLFAPATSLKGVGPKIAPLIEKLAGPHVRDVLFLSTQSLIHRPLTTVDAALEGQVQTFVVQIEAHDRGRGAQPYRIRAFDGSGFLHLAWFKGAGPHLLQQYPVGAKLAVSGKVERWGSEIQMAHPEYRV